MTRHQNLPAFWSQSLHLAFLGIVFVVAGLGARPLAAATLGEALNTPDLTWTTGGGGAWFAQDVVSHDGVAAAQSPAMDYWYNSYLETTVTGQVAVVFWWKLSADPGWWSYYVYTNQQYFMANYGEKDWERRTLLFGGGTNTVRWSYISIPPSAPGQSFSNAAWLDQVLVTNVAGLAPTWLQSLPASVTVPERYVTNAVMPNLVIGEPPLTYYWLHDGAVVPTWWWTYQGADSPILTVQQPGAEQTGNFQLVVSNVWGVVTSSICHLGLTPSAPWLDPNQPADVSVVPNADYWIHPDSVFGSVPYHSQWFKDGGLIPGAESDWYNLNTISPAGGDYQLVVSNDYGSCTSRLVQVTVSTDPPTILREPNAQLVANQGEWTGPGVAAAGPQPLTYLWQKGGVTLADQSSWWSSDGTVGLSIHSITTNDCGIYRVVVSNANGAVLSRACAVAVNPISPLAVALDSPDLPITNLTWNPWFPQNDPALAHDGLVSAQSPAIGDWDETGFETSVAGPGNLRFWWKISASDQAFLELSVDGVVTAMISGEHDWARPLVPLGEGSHMLRWRFYKEWAGVVGADAAWLDQVWVAPTNEVALTNFITGGSVPWFEQTATTHSGISAWQSGLLTDYAQDTWLQTSVAGPGVASFWWSASILDDCGALEFSVDGMVQTNVTDVVAWNPQSWPLSDGNHQLRWRYANGWCFNSSPNANWVDQVHFVPEAPVVPPGTITNFVTGGAAPWFQEMTNTHSGSSAWQSGALTDDQTNWLTATVDGPGLLSFWWRVSSEGCCDPLEFYLDGVLQMGIRGEVGWERQSFLLGSGGHTLEWRYTKDVSVSEGLDAGFVDEITFVASAPGYVFTTGGDASWYQQITNTHSGVAWQSGIIGDGQQSWLETTVTGPGMASFWWSASSEAGSDLLYLLIDGNPQDAIGGAWAWQQRSIPVDAGPHTLQFLYVKNGSGSDGCDAGWMDDFHFMPDLGVQFADTNLAAAVRLQLGLPADAIIPYASVQAMPSLSTCGWSCGQPIANLGGLENAGSLQWLGLAANALTDVTPLAGLTQLESLNLNYNGVYDIFPLIGLWRLHDLRLAYNGTSAPQMLGMLTNLSTLDLSGNGLNDIYFLGNMTQMANLWINQNPITDVTPLAGLTNLTELHASSLQVSDFSVIAGLSNLVTLVMGNNALADANFVDDLVNLEVLDLAGGFLASTPVLNNKPHLRYVDLHGNQITAVPDLTGLEDLSQLFLEDNLIADLSPFANATHLAVLGLSNNRIRNITPLLGLSNLISLTLEGNYLDTNDTSIAMTVIAALQARGVWVSYLPQIIPPDPPLVTLPLTNHWVYPGQSVEFRVEASGSPLSYQWFLDGSPIPGASGSNFSFTASYDNAGQYSVDVSNPFGMISSSARLVVAPIFYEIVDLGASVSNYNFAMGLNNHGDVVGYSGTSAFDGSRPWVWTGGVLVDLGDPLGGGTASAFDINDSGEIVGTAQVAGTTNFNAVVWRRVLTSTGSGGTPLAEAVDASVLALNTLGDAPWLAETTNTTDGFDAACSGLIGDGQNSRLRATVVGPTLVTFEWSVSSEQGHDFLTLLVDDVPQTQISGEVPWQTKAVSVPAGTHSLEWRYAKDGFGASGRDAGFVDQIKVGNYVATDLGRQGWPFACGQAINDAGEIVINVTMNIGNLNNRTAFVWRNGVATPLGGLVPAPGGAGDQPRGWEINSMGMIPGSGGGATIHAWLYNGTWRQDLQTTAGLLYDFGFLAAPVTSIAAVNDWNEVMGYYGMYFGADFGWVGGFLLSGTNCLLPGMPMGLNNHGDALLMSGLYCSSDPNAPARLPDGRPDYSDHRQFNLNDLVPGGLGLYSTLQLNGETYGRINQARAIIGQGQADADRFHALLLRPISRALNTPPVARTDSVTNQGRALLISIPALLANDTDADADPLALLTFDAHSTNGATIRRTGNTLIYTPTNNAVASRDAFAYTVLDFHGGQSIALVVVTNHPSNVAPVILVEPSDQWVGYTNTAVFCVTAEGAGPLAYQWSREGAAILHATNASLILSNVTTADAGAYTVLVSNSYGAIPSRSATLMVQLLRVRGYVGLGDYVGPARDYRGTRTVTFTATDNAGTVLRTWSQSLAFSPDYYGPSAALFSLMDVPLDATHISAKTAWTLRKRLDLTFNNGLAKAMFTADSLLRGGDFDNSNKVDEGDYAIMAGAWYTSNPAADLDGSGLVDIEDYFLMADHWSQEGDPR